MSCALFVQISLLVAAQVGLWLGLPKDEQLINNDPVGEYVAHHRASTAADLALNLTDINGLSTSPTDDPARLWALQLELLALAEDLFGPRDPLLQLLPPQFYGDIPIIGFTLDQTGAFAQLSLNGQYYWPTVVYELAHETVHLLDPVVGNANNLEEGVAVAFSLHIQHLYGLSIQVPSMPSYVYALTLVGKLPGDILSAAGRIRREVGRLSDVAPDDLIRLFPALDARIANELSCKFNRDAVPSDSDTSC